MAEEGETISMTSDLRVDTLETLCQYLGQAVKQQIEDKA